MPNGYVYSFGGRRDSISQKPPIFPLPTNYNTPNSNYKIPDSSFNMYELLPYNVSGNLTEDYNIYTKDYPSQRELHTITQCKFNNNKWISNKYIINNK